MEPDHQPYDIELRVLTDADLASSVAARFDHLFARLADSAAAVGLLGMPSLSTEVTDSGDHLLILQWVLLRSDSGWNALMTAGDVLAQLTTLLRLPPVHEFTASVRVSEDRPPG